MTAFDFGVLGILGASIVVGLLRGLIKEVLSLIAYVAAFLAAAWYGPTVYAGLTTYIENSGLRLIVAYVGVFVGVLLGVGMVNMALSALIRATGLTPADRGLGGVFGVARGALLILAIVTAASYTPLPQEPWWRDALLAPAVEAGIQQLKPWLPAPVGDWIKV